MNDSSVKKSYVFLVDKCRNLLHFLGGNVFPGQQSLEQTMEKLDSIDTEKLNQAIDDLSAVVEPLAKFFNVFQK